MRREQLENTHRRFGPLFPVVAPEGDYTTGFSYPFTMSITELAAWFPHSLETTPKLLAIQIGVDVESLPIFFPFEAAIAVIRVNAEALGIDDEETTLRVMLGYQGRAWNSSDGSRKVTIYEALEEPEFQPRVERSYESLRGFMGTIPSTSSSRVVRLADWYYSYAELIDDKPLLRCGNFLPEPLAPQASAKS